MRLVDVYGMLETAPQILWDLLAEREPHQNISHKRMPTWQQHCRFIASRPYAHWYLIEVDTQLVGTIYLTRDREIGLFVFKEQRGKGIGSQALAQMRHKHPGPMIANVSPRNTRAMNFWETQGFRPLQITYEWSDTHA